MKLVHIINCKNCGHTAEIIGDQPVCVYANCKKNHLEKDEIEVIR